MDGKRLIRSIKLTNLLSFGPDGMEIELGPLNVIVGPNGSGKSNFVSAFEILRAAPYDVTQPISHGGGVQEWLWKGATKTPTAEIEVKVIADEDQKNDARNFVTYRLAFSMVGQRFQIKEERSTKSSSHIMFQPNTAVIHDEDEVVEIDDKKSILSTHRVPKYFPELAFLAAKFEAFGIYSELSRSGPANAQNPQNAALDSTYLFADGSNLALVLNDLQNEPQVTQSIAERIKLFYERFQTIITRVQGGTVQIYFQEAGLTQTVPATRLSIGTLRYLCLLVLLLHPTPPPLMCIEEPELGMHPDILPTIAELLIDASQRTQLIVTTHSEMLVSAIGAKHPDAIVVCERTNKGTTMERLEPEKLAGWLKDYSLGEVWLKGAIGGTRW